MGLESTTRAPLQVSAREFDTGVEMPSLLPGSPAVEALSDAFRKGYVGAQEIQARALQFPGLKAEAAAAPALVQAKVESADLENRQRQTQLEVADMALAKAKALRGIPADVIEANEKVLRPAQFAISSAPETWTPEIITEIRRREDIVNKWQRSYRRAKSDQDSLFLNTAGSVTWKNSALPVSTEDQIAPKNWVTNNDSVTAFIANGSSEYVSRFPSTVETATKNVIGAQGATPVATPAATPVATPAATSGTTPAATSGTTPAAPSGTTPVSASLPTTFKTKTPQEIEALRLRLFPNTVKPEEAQAAPGAFRSAMADVATVPASQVKPNIAFDIPFGASYLDANGIPRINLIRPAEKAESGPKLNEKQSNMISEIPKAFIALQEIKAAYRNYRRNTKVPNILAPLLGAVAKGNPWDQNAQVLSKAIDAAVPGFARGIFGEVGVLTDKDVKRYSDLLPTASTPEDRAEKLIQIIGEKLVTATVSLTSTFKGNQTVDNLAALMGITAEDETAYQKKLADAFREAKDRGGLATTLSEPSSGSRTNAPASSPPAAGTYTLPDGRTVFFDGNVARSAPSTKTAPAVKPR